MMKWYDNYYNNIKSIVISYTTVKQLENNITLK